MYNKRMNIKEGRLKGFTVIETMLFLALTGLMLVGALAGVGTNIARQRYKDSVQDVVTMIRSQYDYVSRVQIAPRDDTSICDTIENGGGTVFNSSDTNLGRGRSNCSVYGVAIVFGVDDEGDYAAGAIVQSMAVLGTDITAFEERISKGSSGNAHEAIAKLSEQELLKELNLNSLIERDNRCEVVNLLDYKVLNWGSKVEDIAENTPKKGIVLIIRSPRDGTVHTYTYDLSGTDTEVPDYSTLSSKNTKCKAFTGEKFDISNLLKNNLFKTDQDFKICITSDDLTGTYGKRRMIRIKADGHNSSAVTLINADSDEGEC